MENYDTKMFKRNNMAIRKNLSFIGNECVAEKQLKVCFPEKYIDKNLSVLGNICHILGVVAINDENNGYGILRIPARLEVIPDEIDTILMNDVPYIQMTIEPGNGLISNTSIVKRDNFAFNLFDLFIYQGKIPWFMNINDVIETFLNLKKYAGSKAGDNELVIEILVSIIARAINDKDILIRNENITTDQLENEPIQWIGLSDPYYSFRSVLNKLVGAYMKEGLVSSIVSPETEVSDLESIVRE